VERLRKDIEDAAGEYLVDLPEPGTPVAVLLSANILMRRENERLRGEVERLRKHLGHTANWEHWHQQLRVENKRLRGLLMEAEEPIRHLARMHSVVGITYAAKTRLVQLAARIRKETEQ
jgi:hypothetical protein